MVFNTDMVIAIKNYQSKYIIEKTDIFKIKNINNKINFLNVVVKNKDIIFKVRCPLCEKMHKYIYSMNDFVNKEVIIGGCETINTPLFFVGVEERVKEMVKQYEGINNQLYNATIK